MVMTNSASSPEPLPRTRRPLARRILRGLAFFVLALVALAAVLVGLVLYGSRDRDHDFYLLHAELRDREHLEKLDKDTQKDDYRWEAFGYQVHRLMAGRGLVIAHRHYSSGEAFLIDDETYSKLTIWLAEDVPLTGKRVLKTPEMALVVYSSGGSAWPRNDCSGHLQGSVELTPVTRGIDVRVNGTFSPSGARKLGDYCKPHDVSLRFLARPARLPDLTAWDGNASGSPHPYDETYWN